MKQPIERPREQWWATGEGVTLGAGVINLALGFVKFFAGTVGGSAAMLADAIHSFSDLATDLVVLLGYRFGRMPEDDDHPYGHGKIETFATLIMGIVIIFVGLGLGLGAIAGLKGGAANIKIPGVIALWAATLSILAKEGLYRWTAWVARGTQSSLILSNAWHHRSDALSSIAALVGVAGARWGLWWADPVAVIVVSGFIIKVGFELGWPAFRDLTDASVGEDLLTTLCNLIEQVEGVKGHHSIRARRAGASILVDVDIEVDPGLNVIQGHDLARDVKKTLMENVKGVLDVMVHIEPTRATDDVAMREKAHELSREIALSTEGVRGVHGIKVIPAREGCLVNLDIEVEPEMTVAKAHNIAHLNKVKIRELPGVGDAVIHVDVHGSTCDG